MSHSALCQQYSSLHFEAYFRGDLDTGEENELLSHLSECTPCLEASQAAWDEVSPLTQGWPEPDKDWPQSSSRLEQRTLRQVHLWHLFGDSITFLVRGAGVVFAALLQPFSTGDERSRRDPRRVDP